MKASHVDKAPGMTDADLAKAFSYLAQYFGPDRPEPNVMGLPTTSSAE